jgi:hypothetical protein
MAITRPVTFSQALIGDGVSTTLVLSLTEQIVQQGLSASAVPQVIVSLMLSDGSTVTGVLSGQTITVTFATAPASLAIKTLVMTLGF